MSVLTLTAISIDRYYAVCYPLKFKSSLNQAKKIIVCIWIVSLILMAPDLIYLSAKMSPELAEAGLNTVLYSDCNYDWSERSSRTFQFVKTILLYLLPLILMLCAHFKIMQTLQQASKSVNYKLEQVIAAPQPHQASAETHSHEAHQLSNMDNFNLSAAAEQVVAASSAPANMNPLNTTNAAAAAATPFDKARNLRQIRFAGSSTGSGQSNAPSSRQSTTTTTNTTITTVNTIPSSIPVVLDEAVGETDNSPAAANVKRKLSKSVSEALSRFRLSRSNCASFASSTGECQVVDFGALGRKFRDYRNNGSICSTSNQYEINGRGSLSNPNQLMMVTMHNKNKLESRRRAAKMLMTIVVMFGICYLPVHLINFLR